MLGYTTNVGAGRPWATTIMFKTDRNGSNQHIWNSGEGAGTTDDNIYLRTNQFGALYFGWGREGVGYNEYKIADSLGTGCSFQDMISMDYYQLMIMKTDMCLSIQTQPNLKLICH